ncbi:MAG: FkbM family methyltransferase [Chitinophagaceae bacterium]|nr:FkbM family methyltransferase [Chitinophagaceae bacterium]
MKPFNTIYNYLVSYHTRRSHKKLSLALYALPGDFNITLIDIGAAMDIEPRWKKVEHFLNYIGFEPDERSRKSLLDKPNKCFSYNIIPKAVWETSGVIDINFCVKPMVSSYYLPNREFVDLFPYADRFEIASIESLEAIRLDDLSLAAADFIKIDIQGGELNALKGGEVTLKKTIGLDLEVEFLPIYKDQPLFGDIQQFLYERGFEFIDFVNLSRWEREAHNGFGQCIFGDALFMRTPENIMKTAESDTSMIAKYLGLCLIYNRFDLIDQTVHLMPPDMRTVFSNFVSAITSLKRKHAQVKRMSKKSFNWMRILVGGDYQPHILY